MREFITCLATRLAIIGALALTAALPARATLLIDDFSLDQNPAVTPEVFGGAMFTGSREIATSGPQYTTAVSGGLLRVDALDPVTVLRYPANGQDGVTFNLMPDASGNLGAYALTYRSTVPAQMILSWTLEPAPGIHQQLTWTTALDTQASFTTSVFDPAFDASTPFWTTRNFAVRFQFNSATAGDLFEIDRLELVSTAPVPEGGTMGLMVAGLLGIAARLAARRPGRGSAL
jgi:hypothetical protein